MTQTEPHSAENPGNKVPGDCSPHGPSVIQRESLGPGVVMTGGGDSEMTRAELRESRRALSTLMDNLPGMAYRCRNDENWTMEFVSNGALELTGYAPAQLISNSVISYGELIRVEDREPVFEQVQAALRERTSFRLVYRINPATGPEKWVWEQGCGVFSEDGELQLIEGFITDITEARRAEESERTLMLEQAAREVAEAAEGRAKFLSEASRVLGASLDYNTTLAALARLAVPAMADFCVVDVVENGVDFVRLGVAHIDPVKESLLRELSHYRVDAMHPKHPIIRAILERRSTFLPEVSMEVLKAQLPGEKQRHVIGRLNPRSMITVPLIVSDRVVGALTLIMSDSGRRHTPEDLVLAEELARRVAFAVENTRLFREAQQASLARDRVLAVVAHDLRNPLGTVLLAAQLLLRKAVEGERRDHMEIIQRSATQMNRLIQDLLEVTRIESGHLAIEPRLDTVGRLIDEAVAMLRPLAAGRSIVLESQYDGELPKVHFDSPRMLQVLSNIIGNAIKFTPIEGRISICCEVAGEEICFSVADNGPGISPDHLPHIFGSFWQASATDRRGIGLGLSIAQGIVEAHGGRIWVESTQGVGTTFYFTLPMAK